MNGSIRPDRLLAGQGKPLAMAVSCIVLLFSCASPPSNMHYPVHVTNTAVIDLLPPASMNGTIDGLYSFTMATGKSSFSAMAYLTADDTGVYAALMNDFGIDIANLTYTGEDLTLTSKVLPRQLKAQYLVADLQFALYNEDVLHNVLKDAHLTFEAEEGGKEGGKRRTIRKGKKVIEEIEIEEGNIKIKNVLRGYELMAIAAGQE